MSSTHVPPAPKGQGEIDVGAFSAPPYFNDSRAGGYQHPCPRPPHTVCTCNNTCECAIESDIDHASCLRKIGHGGLRKVSFLESRLGGGDGIDKEVDRSGIDKDVDRTRGGLGE